MTTSTVMPGLGHNGGPPLTGITNSPWLAGTPARISRRKRPAATSGKAHTGEWVLRFERNAPPFVEPLMGWTGGDDTLSQVELTFASREEAIRYAEREGLSYRVEGEAMAATQAERLQAADPEEFAAVREAATEFSAEPPPRAGRLCREAPGTGEWSNLA